VTVRAVARAGRRSHAGSSAGLRRRGAARLLPPIGAALAALALGGCGAAYPDLFLLTRSGSLPGAKLTLLVGDGGTVRCNHGTEQPLPDPLLLDARHIATSLADDADKDLALPRRPGALLRYRLQDQQGSVTFSDIDAGAHSELADVIVFARTVAKTVCGLAR
jgi:hypothetical protein